MGIFVFYAILLAVVIPSAVIYSIYNKKKEKKLLESLADHYGLKAAAGVSNSIYGNIDDNIYLALDMVTQNRQNIIRFTMNYILKDNIYFSITKENFFSGLSKAGGFNDYQTGAEDFDFELFISNTISKEAIAYLDYDVRKIIISLKHKSFDFKITNNSLNISIYNNFNETVTVRTIDMAADIVKAFSKDINIHERFLNTIKNEIDGGFFVNAVNNYVALFGEDERLKEVLKIKIKSPDREKKYISAVHLGIEGLFFLLEELLNNSADDVNYAINIIQLFRIKSFTDSSFRLTEYYKTCRTDEIKIEILKAFKEFKNTELNDFLIQELDCNYFYIKLAAVEALAVCGKLSAVEKLYMLSKEPLNFGLKNAVQNAIAKIQLREGSGENGMLSTLELTETDGALSINDENESGMLSRAGEE